MKLIRKARATYVVGEPAEFGAIARPNAPATTAEVAQSLRGKRFAILDGALFSYCPTETRRSYGSYQCGTLDYALIDSKSDFSAPGHHPDRGITILVTHGNGAMAFRGVPSVMRSTVQAMVQCYPSLVFDGAPSDARGDDSTQRSVLGVLQDGRVFLALFPSQALSSLPRLLSSETIDGSRVKHAGNLDGGGSASMYVDLTGTGNADYSHNTRGRRVISWVTLTESRSPVRVAISNLGDKVRAWVGLGFAVAMAVGIAATAVVAVMMKEE